MSNTPSTQKNKIPAVYLNDETHQVMKKWAQYQGTTIPKLAQALLEQMQPVLEQMTQAYEEIMEGKDQEQALKDLLTKGVEIANQKYDLIEETENATDKRKGS